MDAFVLTLKLDEKSFAFFDALRRRHFPPERNQVPAHLTLFHALPGEEMATIRPLLAGAARDQRRIDMKVTGVKSLGGGTAFTLQAPALSALRKALQREMEPFLTMQDRGGFSPHVTVQNKVPVKEGEALRRELQKDFRPFGAKGEGLLLWRYLGGPWLREAQFPFRG
ncbi:2'-5' RNA ligase family protein [Afifella sp. IM 167]|uniref:2'-5' RNA ligase family protein n=1 Tax=Afifella sp. IM 167 TaxID=2033586 RepID=UPI001CC984E2|nr:2'-5' RNA ligase family protein [Afifella sp. IM 167]MBZ8133440.1 phosphoesterase HXTX [Afifella sp. IM 167]